MSEIQRYTPDSFTSTKDGSVIEGNCFADDYGDYILHSDHLTALAAKDEQIDRMRQGLVKLRGGVLLMVPEPQQTAFIEIIKAALASAPEGEKQPVCAKCKGTGMVSTRNGSSICACSEGWDNNDEG